jgi:hypothetical protein
LPGAKTSGTTAMAGRATSATTAAEQSLQEVIHSTHATRTAERVATAAEWVAATEWITPTAEHVSHLLFLVEFTARLGITDFLVRRLDALEAFLGRRVVITVGMVLAGEFPIGPLNLGITGILGYAKHSVGVGLRH